MIDSAGQGQGLNQRTGIVDVDGGVSCGAAHHINPPPTSPIPTPQKTQRLYIITLNQKHFHFTLLPKFSNYGGFNPLIHSKLEKKKKKRETRYMYVYMYIGVVVSRYKSYTVINNGGLNTQARINTKCFGYGLFRSKVVSVIVNGVR